MKEIIPGIKDVPSFDEFYKAYHQDLLTNPGVKREVIGEQEFPEFARRRGFEVGTYSYGVFRRVYLGAPESKGLFRSSWREFPRNLDGVFNLHSWPSPLVPSSDLLVTLNKWRIMFRMMPNLGSELNLILSIKSSVIVHPDYWDKTGWAVSSIPEDVKSRMHRLRADSSRTAKDILMSIIDEQEYATVIQPNPLELRSLAQMLLDRESEVLVSCNVAALRSVDGS